jgi:3-dehydrotetronate 4-kinase
MTTPSILLGCIADDFTGATDLASNLVRAGMRVTQVIGVPNADLMLDTQVDAIVVSLKSRTNPVAEAVKESIEALHWLQGRGAQQIYFKYCSTFDSVYEGPIRGNIGPVTEALMEALNTDFTIATPAFPENQRTVFKGHLFVGDALLSESGMQNHPITPMKDANLVRVLQAQCTRKVGLIDYKVIAQGEAAILSSIAALRASGVGIAVVDALSNQDLMVLGRALKEMPLVTAGSGVAISLPQNFGLGPSGSTRGSTRGSSATQLPRPEGLQAIVSGSCSMATNRQVADFVKRGLPALAIDPMAIDPMAIDSAREADTDYVDKVLRWVAPKLAVGPVLIYSTASPESIKAVQSKLGVEPASHLVEETLAKITKGLLALGVRQLVIAGGETSGACVQALQIKQLQIGAQIDPGVPWCFTRPPSLSGEGLHVTLKSGNFGTDDFFSKAFGVLK